MAQISCKHGAGDIVGSRLRSFLEGPEHPAMSFAHRTDATVGADLHASLGHGDGSHARCQAPDVVDGDTGELAAPAHGTRDAAEGGEDDVAQRLPHVEALVRVLPHAVDTASCLRLGKHIFKSYLDMAVDRVGVTVAKVTIPLPFLGDRHCVELRIVSCS